MKVVKGILVFLSGLMIVSLIANAGKFDAFYIFQCVIIILLLLTPVVAPPVFSYIHAKIELKKRREEQKAIEEEYNLALLKYKTAQQDLQQAQTLKVKHDALTTKMMCALTLDAFFSGP